MARNGNSPKKKSKADKAPEKPDDWRPGANGAGCAEVRYGSGLLELFQSSQEAMLVCDAGRIIRFWNVGAQSLFGLAPAEAIGRDASTLLEGGWPFPAQADVLISLSREAMGIR